MLTAMAGGEADGQALSKEITVDKDVVPQEREATRLALTPKLVLPAIQQPELRWTSRGVAAHIEPTLVELPPTAYASTLSTSPYRGYVAAGYFPACQLGAAAGYRLVDESHSRLNAWITYNGSSVDRTPPLAESKIRYNAHDARLGLDGFHSFAGGGTLRGRASYGLSSFNFPTSSDKGFTQRVSRADIGLGWQARAGQLDYDIAADYDYFGFDKPVAENISGLKGNGNSTFTLALRTGYALNDCASIGASVDFAATSFSSALAIDPGAPAVDAPLSGDVLGKVRYNITDVHPYVGWKGENLSVRAGIGVQLAGGDLGSNRLRPDLRLDWTPTSHFALWAQLNDRRAEPVTLASRYDRNRYINPNQVAGPMWDKWRIEGGFILGPWAGASVEVWGGVAKVNSYFAPTLYVAPGLGSVDDAVEKMTMGAAMAIDNFTDAHYGIALNYDYRRLASLRLSYEGAPADFDQGNINATDRARHVLAGKLVVRPLQPLDLSVAYTLRSGRRIYAYSTTPTPIGLADLWEPTSLGVAASLDLGASWRFSDRFNIWARVENLLNRRWQVAYAIPNPGVTGLAGIALRF